MISLEATFDKKIYTRFFWYDSITSWRFLPFVMAELAALTMVLDNWIFDKPYKIMSCMVMLAVVAAWYFSRRRRLQYTIRKGGLQNKVIRMQYQFGENKIAVQNKTTGRHSNHKWSDIRKLRTPDKSVYLYLSADQALILDKRLLTKEQLEQLKAYVEKGLAEAKIQESKRKALNKTTTKKGR